MRHTHAEADITQQNSRITGYVAMQSQSFLKSKRQLQLCTKYSGAHLINNRNSKFTRYETEYANNKDYFSNQSRDSNLHLFHDTFNEQLLKHFNNTNTRITVFLIVNLRERGAEIFVSVGQSGAPLGTKLRLYSPCGTASLPTGKAIL